jgi:hypothetical protein
MGARSRLASVSRAAAITMEGAPSCWANLMKMAAVEAANIPANKLKISMVRLGAEEALITSVVYTACEVYVSDLLINLSSS